MMIKVRIIAHAGVCSLLILGQGMSDAGASDLAYELEGGVGHSDNISRLSTSEQDDTIAKAGLKFSFDQMSKRLQADLLGDLAYFEYLDDTYDSEVLGSFIGNARLGLIPERFEWVISDNYGQVLNDPFEPVTPDNRENINYFTTGPDLILAFGSRNRLTMGARYANTVYEDSPLDSQGYSGQIGFAHLMSAASSLSLNARTLQVDYDEDILDADGNILNSDYAQSEAFVSYAIAGARTHLSLDLGYTQLDRDAATDKEDGALARLNVSRRVSPASTATLTAGHEFQNSAGAFASIQGGGATSGVGAVPGRQTAQPFMNDYVTLGWNFSRVRTGFSLNASLNKQTYDDAPELDQTVTVLSAQLTRALSQRSTVALHGAYSQGDFSQSDVLATSGDYKDTNVGLNFTWRLSRAWSLNATYDYFHRSSDAAVGGYDENRYWLSIIYGRGTPRATPLAPAFAVDAAADPASAPL
jgi:hypothetical protein